MADEAPPPDVAATTGSRGDHAGTSAVDRRAIAREALVASVGVLSVLGLIKHLSAVSPFVYEHGFTLALAFQLYVPLYLIGRRGVTRETLGLSFAAWRTDLRWFAIVAGLTIVPYAIGLHFYMTILEGRPFVPRWPTGLAEGFVVNLALVGLAEELFFRGYLQERWAHVWPDRARWWGASVGPAIVVASAVFALAHFVGEYAPTRLGPFFPGLVFGWLRAKTGTIVAAVGYHAFCNVLADALLDSYRWG